jgi:hypothetical protein
MRQRYDFVILCLRLNCMFDCLSSVILAWVYDSQVILSVISYLGSGE